MKQDTWAALDTMFIAAPVLRAGEAEASLIAEAEAELGVPFPEAYREFLVRHGGGMVGPYPIYGVKCSAAIERNGTVGQVTRRFRSQRWPGTERWLVFSMDHGGNPVGFDEDGAVWMFDHDHGGVQRLADGFEAYLRGWCLKMPK